MEDDIKGFFGARLKQAREALGLSATELANEAGISKQIVAKYESNEKKPSPATLDKLAAILGVGTSLFVSPPADFAPLPVFYRSLKSESQKSKSQVEAKLRWLREVYSFFEDRFILPDLNLPDVFIDKDIKDIEDSEIDEIALQARLYWKLDLLPIPNMIKLLESNGIIVAEMDLLSNKMDAFSQWGMYMQSPLVVLGADKGVAVRSRFDAAHELGHIILHQSVQNQERIEDKEYNDLLEKQANRFASEFLFPKDAFLSEVIHPSLDVFMALKQKWGVSIKAMIVKASDLRLLNPDETKRTYMNYYRRGWGPTKKGEPYDDSLIKEKPTLFKSCVEYLIEKQGWTKTGLANVLSYPTLTLEKLLGLEKGFFSQEETGGFDLQVR